MQQVAVTDVVVRRPGSQHTVQVTLAVELTAAIHQQVIEGKRPQLPLHPFAPLSVNRGFGMEQRFMLDNLRDKTVFARFEQRHHRFEHGGGEIGAEFRPHFRPLSAAPQGFRRHAGIGPQRWPQPFDIGAAADGQCLNPAAFQRGKGGI